MNKIPDRIRFAALELTDKGVSVRDAAAQLTKRFKRRVCWQTVHAWVRQARAAALAADADDAPPSSVPPAPAPPFAVPEPEAPPVDDGASLAVKVARILVRVERLADVAEREGNLRAAQQAFKAAGELTNQLQRLEASEKKAGDGYVFTKEQLEARKRLQLERAAALHADIVRQGGVLRCPDCQREIRIRSAKGEV